MALVHRIAMAIVMYGAAAMIGCEPLPAATLATIDEVNPKMLEPGDILKIGGTGFVEGPARISFEGEFDPYGMVGTAHRRIELDGTAVSDTLVQIPITNTVMSTLAVEPVEFMGKISARFPSALSMGETRIQAVSRVVSLDLRPTGGGIEAAARRSRESEVILDLAGISLARSEVGNELIVRSVTREGLADRHGIDHGDRFLSVDNVALATPSDLAGLDPEGLHTFEFLTVSGEVRAFRARLTSIIPLEVDEFAAIFLTSVALGFFLAFAGRRWNRPPPDTYIRTGNPLVTALGLSVASVPMLLVPTIVISTRADMCASLTLLVAVVAGLAIVALYGRGPAVYRVFGAIMHLLPVPIALVLAGTLGSSFGMWNLVASQESSLWGWHAWSNPFALAAFVLAISMLWPALPDRKNPTLIAGISSWFAAVSGAMAITACGFGGWLIPSFPMNELVSSDTTMLLVGVAVFALKTWLVLLTAKWFWSARSGDRRARVRQGRQTVVRAALLVVTAALAMAWNWYGLPEDLVAAGRVLAAGVSVVLATAFMATRIGDLIEYHLGVGDDSNLHDIVPPAKAILKN